MFPVTHSQFLLCLLSLKLLHWENYLSSQDFLLLCNTFFQKSLTQRDEKKSYDIKTLLSYLWRKNTFCSNGLVSHLMKQVTLKSGHFLIICCISSSDKSKGFALKLIEECDEDATN